jgi:hypothetical protein
LGGLSTLATSPVNCWLASAEPDNPAPVAAPTHITAATNTGHTRRSHARLMSVPAVDRVWGLVRVRIRDLLCSGRPGSIGARIIGGGRSTEARTEWLFVGLADGAFSWCGQADEVRGSGPVDAGAGVVDAGVAVAVVGE